VPLRGLLIHSHIVSVHSLFWYAVLFDVWELNDDNDDDDDEKKYNNNDDDEKKYNNNKNNNNNKNINITNVYKNRTAANFVLLVDCHFHFLHFLVGFVLNSIIHNVESLYFMQKTID